MDEKGPAGGYGAAPSGDEMGGTGSAAPMIENRGGVASAGGAAGRSGGGEGKGPDRGGARGSAGDPRAPEGTPTTVERPGAGGDQECCDPTPALREPPQATVAVCSWCRGRGCGLCNMSGRPTRSDSGSPRAKLAYLLRQQRDGTPRAADDVPTDAAVAAMQQPKVYTLEFFEGLMESIAVTQPYWQNNAALKWFSKVLSDGYKSANRTVFVVKLAETVWIPSIMVGEGDYDYRFSEDDGEWWSWLQMIAHLCEEDMKTVVEGQDGRSGGLVSCEVFMLQPCREFATSLPETVSYTHLTLPTKRIV